MFGLYLILTKAIRASVPDLRWIDLDKGQLDNPDQYHALIAPAVLVSAPELNWTQLGRGREQGEGTVTVKAVVRLPAGTYDIDPLIDLNLNELDIADQVHDATLNVPGINSRTSSRAYPEGAFYVIENTYACLTEYGGPLYKRVPVQVHINPTLFKPTAQA